MKNQIYPCLWFNGKAKEAAEFYCSIFSNTKITSESPMVVNFESAGQKFMCLNGGPQFIFNPSISFYVVFENESEIDAAWEKLLEDGQVLMPYDKYDWSEKYGWLQDKFGVSWQLALGKIEDVGQKITPVLMFTKTQAGNAEKAIGFYTSVFDNSSVVGIMRYTAEDPDTEGTIKHAQFKLNKQVFMAMDSSLSHNFSFNEAISFVCECDTQKQIDYYWKKLSAVPEAEQCGWLKDQFGISWQIIPSVLEKLMSDPASSERVVQAFLKMKKFDIVALENA
ncbi:VOC family protein [Maribellus maritimus]|uniref:VOC family protein n=1 Tax=Maribellus maritimus TaxID=2870838 RepID=UPI001EEAF5EF|nr:VOC family protein [Maribellus maritimus]MCG6188293.1 VOC family protein [Maribellus maritimus]